MKKIYSLLFFVLFTSIGVYAQVTTASLSGVVTSGNETIPGATIIAIHEPSGTRYGNLSNRVCV